MLACERFVVNVVKKLTYTMRDECAIKVVKLLSLIFVSQYIICDNFCSILGA